MQNKSGLLIINHEGPERETLKRLLLENYQMTFVASIDEALQQVTELMPDLILLDQVMLGTDGIEACQCLRSHSRLTEVPIIMLTNISDHQTRLRAMEAGVDDFIIKPIDEIELLTRVRTITRLNRYRHLLAERVRFEWAVEQSNDGYLLLRNGDEIRYANSCARYYLGLFKESSLKDGFLNRINQQNFKREPESAWEDWPNPNVGSKPRYLIRPETGQSPLVWLQIDILELPSHESNGQLVHLRDISEPMNLQQQMWTFQTLVSHKLRAPLNGLVSLQMLDKKNMDLSSDRANALLKIARESAKRLQDQILDILRYVDSSQLLQLDTAFKLYELSTLLNNIKNDLEISTVIVEIADNEVEKSLAFSSQGIELVLRELFTNSKKFHPQHSPIIEVSVTRFDDTKMLLRISDDGQYLPNKDLSKVWTPYYQSEKSFTGEIKGMGLGLAMIARLVWSSGGNYHLFNREEKPGVTMDLVLPLSIEEPNN